MSIFRPCVVLVLENQEGHILACERTDLPGCWQFPQGGIKPGESPEQALARETFEEIGLSPSQYRILSQTGPHNYLFPPGYTKEGFLGQTQTYFHAQLTTPNPSLDFGPPSTAEFRDAKWLHPHSFPIHQVHPIKRHIYQSVLAQLFPQTPNTPATDSNPSCPSRNSPHNKISQ